MKIRVIKAYRDKDTLLVHGIGDIVEYSPDRGSYIISLGYGEEVKEELEEKTETVEEVEETEAEEKAEEKVEEKPKKKTTKSRGSVK